MVFSLFNIFHFFFLNLFVIIYILFQNTTLKWNFLAVSAFFCLIPEFTIITVWSQTYPNRNKIDNYV